MKLRLLIVAVVLLAPVVATAGSNVIPSPDSDTNVKGPNPNTSRGPCIVDGMVLQDCAPRDWQRKHGSQQNIRPMQRIAPKNNKGGSSVVPLNN